jgi:LPXTG-site transpeptidase (sortase) family protein
VLRLRERIRGLLGASRRRRLLAATGTVLLLTGFALLVAAAFVFVNEDNGPPQPLDAGRDLWSNTRFTYETPTPGPVNPPLGDTGYNIVIDKINVNAPVHKYGIDPATIGGDPTPEVPTGADAREVVAWYDFSARPATGGNAVFSGHVTWFGPAVFYNLGAMETGDVVRLVNHDGTQVVYTVTEVFLVDASDPNAVTVMYETNRDMITIITCGGDYSPTGDPVFGGRYSHRVVVRGDLEAVVPPSGG